MIINGKTIKKVKDVEFYAYADCNKFDGSEQYNVYARSSKQKQDKLLACVELDEEAVMHCIEAFSRGFNFFNKFKLEA
jgi:hypothetical protein